MTFLSFPTLPTPARSPFFRPSQNLSHAGLLPASVIVIRCSRISLLSLGASLSLSLPEFWAMPFQVVIARANYTKRQQSCTSCYVHCGLRTWKFWLCSLSTLRMDDRGNVKPLPLGPPPWV